MTDNSLFLLEETKEGMESAIKHLEKEFHKIRAGKASPAMLEGVKFDYYGTMTAVEQAANVHAPDPKQIIVQPFDKNALSAIEKAIMAANLGFNPRNDGQILRIPVPPPTEERRRQLVKLAKTESEDAKVSIRNIRRTAMEDAKKLEKAGVPEDEVKLLEKEIQKLTDFHIQVVDKHMETKEKEIMTI